MGEEVERGRRGVLRGGAALVAAGLGTRLHAAPLREGQATGEQAGGRLKQSVSRWCFGSWSVDELAGHAARIGYKGIDLLGPEDWAALGKHGLVCALGSLGGPVRIEKGLNRVENHPPILEALRRGIDLASEAKVPNLVCFSGNREGMSDTEGLENCARGLLQLARQAEKKGVTLCVELLNSKIDHKDYMCDHTAWGAALVKKVGSPRVKLLYDIYHMQIMEGDVIATIRANHQHIAHYHTGGVPGRAEIDETQELNYRRIAQEIVDLGFEGYLAQEFIPKRDPMASLKQGMQICDA